MEIIGLALMSIPVILYTTGFFDLNIDDYHYEKDIAESSPKQTSQQEKLLRFPAIALLEVASRLVASSSSFHRLLSQPSCLHS